MLRRRIGGEHWTSQRHKSERRETQFEHKHRKRERERERGKSMGWASNEGNQLFIESLYQRSSSYAIFSSLYNSPDPHLPISSHDCRVPPGIAHPSQGAFLHHPHASQLLGRLDRHPNDSGDSRWQDYVSSTLTRWKSLPCRREAKTVPSSDKHRRIASSTSSLSCTTPPLPPAPIPVRMCVGVRRLMSDPRCWIFVFVGYPRPCKLFCCSATPRPDRMILLMSGRKHSASREYGAKVASIPSDPCSRLSKGKGDILVDRALKLDRPSGSIKRLIASARWGSANWTRASLSRGA